ncbi:MAG TPA: ATP-binding protein [Thermoanaerobaculia bacterium]
MPLQIFRLLLLGGALAAPFLPLPWPGLVLLVLFAVWLWRLRPPRREVILVALSTGVAVAALGVLWAAEIEAEPAQGEWVEEAKQEYALLWSDLRQEAAAAAEALGEHPEDTRARLEAFRRLAELDAERPRGRQALLLLDPDGAAVAWAGEGLLHESAAHEVPRAGLYYQASFGSVTFLAVEPLPADREARRPWRVVAGASYPTDVLPIPARPRNLRWSVVDASQSALPGSVVVPLAGAPTLVVSRPGEEPPGPSWALRLAWAAIAFGMLGIAFLRGVIFVLPVDTQSQPESRLWLTLIFFGGVFAAGMAASLPLPHLALLAAGLGLAIWGLSFQKLGSLDPHPLAPSPVTGRGGNPEEEEKRSGGGAPLPVTGEGTGVRAPSAGTAAPAWWLPALLGAASALALFGAAWVFQSQGPPIDLAPGILAGPRVFSLRVAFAAAAFGLLCLSGLRRGGELPRDRWAWWGAAALLAGATLCDVPWAALPLLASGGAAAAVYADRRRLVQGMALAGLLLMSLLTASVAWETAYQLRLRGYAEAELLPRLTPPTQEEMSSLAREIRDHFSSRDLRSLAPRPPAGLERQDLAFALWRGSPLARPNAISALVIRPREGAASSFSFGMPPARRQGVEWSFERWREVNVEGWDVLSGQVDVYFAGQVWGTARYWLLPRPGFQRSDPRRLGDIEVDLLKGGPPDPGEDLSEPFLYALFRPDGRAYISPWVEEPSLAAALRRDPGQGVRVGVVDTPDGRARAYVRRSPVGWEVVYLPLLRATASLERATYPAAGVVLLLALCAPSVLLLALPRAAFRAALRRVWRSYSQRLMAVYTILLLVPLVLLNAVLVRSMQDRLQQEQSEEGKAALISAQKFLGEELLNLPPGFGVDTVLGDRLLLDLSEVVQHEVNLYYGSGIYASSKHELFTAGLLPNRIPGEIFSRLALLGDGLWSRLNRVADTTYLEIYAPLRVPGMPAGEGDRLFLSMPLLAQQEEASRELAHLRRQGFLVTLGLFILLVAVGTRLARNFTRPIMALVEGTRRIAGGAASLELSPSELELAALVEAIDDMALRIAEGREKLVREKQVVERMVENITSGVVSLDREGKVLMHNRVAAELLGARVGESLERLVAGQERLGPVAGFLRSAGREMARETVRLAGPEEEREWSLVWVPLPGAGEPSALLVVEDATEVLRGQRLLAWAEMARIIAHEIKNPLTPIRLSAEHMREVYDRDPDHFGRVFERCTNNILTQVEELRSIASEFSAYSAILRIDPKPGDLTAAIADLVEAYQAAPPDGVSVGLETDGPLPARFDAKLLGRAVRNLLENALRAASAGGGEVLVRVAREDGLARISVLDNGPGVRPENLLRIFDPYFSTHETGTGLGLPIARRVVEEHGGNITARNRTEGGLEVTITLPV